MNAATTHRPAPRAAASARPLEFVGEQCLLRSFVRALVFLSLFLCASLPSALLTREHAGDQCSTTLSSSRGTGEAGERKRIATAKARNFRFCVACFFSSSPSSPLPLLLPALFAFQNTHARFNFHLHYTDRGGGIRAPISCKELKRRGAEREGVRSRKPLPAAPPPCPASVEPKKKPVRVCSLSPSPIHNSLSLNESPSARAF